MCKTGAAGREEDINILNEALGEDAAKYEVDKVETQVVARMNYKFYAKDIETGENVYIVVFRSLEESEKPVVTEILPVE